MVLVNQHLTQFFLWVPQSIFLSLAARSLQSPRFVHNRFQSFVYGSHLHLITLSFILRSCLYARMGQGISGHDRERHRLTQGLKWRGAYKPITFFLDDAPYITLKELLKNWLI